MPNVKLANCQHDKPVTMTRTENGEGHWLISSDCCESVIDWNWPRLARSWNNSRNVCGPVTHEGT